MSKSSPDIIVITGADGLVGGHLTKLFAEAGNSVLAVTRNRSFQPPHGASRALWEELKKELNGKPIKAVFHCAATHPTSRAVADAEGLVSGNITLTKQLLDNFTDGQIEKFFYCSSLSVYGPDVIGPLREDGPLGTIGTYGNVKLLTEQLLQESRVSKETLVWRLAGILAPGNLNPLPGRWIQKILANEVIEVTDPDAKYNHAYLVQDLVALAAALILKKLPKFSVVNVASSNPITLEQLASQIRERFPQYKLQFQWKVSPHKRDAADISKLRALLGGIEPRATAETVRIYLNSTPK